MVSKIRRIGILVQITADNSLRLIPLGDLNSLDRSFATHVSVVANKVDEVGTVAQRLRHNGVVVTVFV